METSRLESTTQIKDRGMRAGCGREGWWSERREGMGKAWRERRGKGGGPQMEARREEEARGKQRKREAGGGGGKGKR